VRTNLVGNAWTGEQLAAEITAAARVKAP
jgi:hypothetical protein